MFLFFKSLPRLWKKAFKDLNQHFSMTFSSIFSISIALLIAVLMAAAALNLNQIAQGISDEFIMQVSLSPKLSETQIQQLENTIEKYDDVQSVSYSTKEEELQTLIDENGQMFAQYEGERNPLYDVLEVSVTSISAVESLTESIENLSGVISVDYGGWIILTIMKIFDATRIIGLILVAVMIFLAFFLIRSSIRMTLSSREDEIAIMRQVGAYNWYIMMPFVLQGMVIGLVGAAIPSLLFFVAYPAFYLAMHGVLMSDLMTLVQPYPFITYMILAMLAAGLFIGMTGSWAATRKVLKEKR